MTHTWATAGGVAVHPGSLVRPGSCELAGHTSLGVSDWALWN